MAHRLGMAHRWGMARRSGMTHRSGMTQRLPSALPQRGCILQPRVAAPPLPWVCGVIHPTNPDGVAYTLVIHPTVDTTPLGLAGMYGRFPRVAGNPQPWAGGWNPVGIPDDLRTKAKPIGIPDDLRTKANPVGIPDDLRTKTKPIGIPGDLRAKANPIGVAVYPLQSKLPGELTRMTQCLGMSQHLPSALPQRGNVPQPRVAAEPLPWGNGVTHSTNPNGVVSLAASDPIVTAKQLASIVRAEMEGGR